MALISRPSQREDREQITSLMRESLGLPSDAAAIELSFQDWKYWLPHPLSAASRGCVIRNGDRLAAHGSKWPIRLHTGSEWLECHHLIDWVATRSVPGAGVALLKACNKGSAAVFAIGGSAMTRQIMPAIGFQPKNQIYFLGRPLQLLSPAMEESARDWKFPARVARNAYRHCFPVSWGTPQGTEYRACDWNDIPERMYPQGSPTRAVSARSSELFQYLAVCPRFERMLPYLLSQAGREVAYCVMAQVGSQVRMIDYGPDGLTAADASLLGRCAQRAARFDFPGASTILAATTEPAVGEGFLRSGMRLHFDECIKVLALAEPVKDIREFRLTMMDWDIACL